MSHGRRFGWLVGVLITLAWPAQALADTTINFDDLAPGATVTNQYADVGGSGQGVVFGPLPGGAGDGLRPVITSAPGQAESDSQVASIDDCPGCEFPAPVTTGTFQVPRTRVKVAVGYLGTHALCLASQPDSAACAFVTLTAYDSNGQPVGTPATARVTQGGGVTAVLTISTPTAQILGFKIAARSDKDLGKAIAIDDLSFDTPSGSTPPDFTLIPANADLTVTQGQSTNDQITIGRIGGSTGDIQFAVTGPLPDGVTAQVAPNPATGHTTTLTVTAAPDAPSTAGSNPTITITGSPLSSSSGTASHQLTLHVAVQPAFDVGIKGPTHVGLGACTVTVPVAVSRALSFPGPVLLTVTGLPVGVTGAFDQSQVTFPGGTTEQDVNLILSVPEGGERVIARTVAVHASASGFGERIATFTVGGFCPMRFDPEVTSMQITQGTQLPVLPARNPSNPAAPITYGSLGQAAQPGTLQALARLSSVKTTVVRVYADLRYGPPGGLSVPAVLRGWRYGSGGQLVELPGSPISPVESPKRLILLSPMLRDLIERDTGVYTFALPSAWTRGRIKLEADLLPTQVVLPQLVVQASALASAAAIGPPQLAPCVSLACQIDNKFAISEIPFAYTHPVTIRPLAMIRTNPYDNTLPDPDSVFQWARVVSPMEVNVEPYATTIDIGDLVAQSKPSTTEALDRVRHYVCNHGEPSAGWDVGVEHDVPHLRSAKGQGSCYEFPAGISHHDMAFVSADRPLTSVAHEVFHLYGRPHASAACGSGIDQATPPEPWPPDESGFIQSVGLEPAVANSGRIYQLIAGTSQASDFKCRTDPFSPSSCGGANPQQSFDFMSYCGASADGDPRFGNTWVSVHNWNAVMASFGYGPARDVRSHPPRPRAATVPSLHVTADVDPTGAVRIATLDPVPAPRAPAGNSDYHLIATDKAGHATVDVPLQETFGHADGVPAEPILTLSGVVPVSGTDAVEIVKHGTMLARRAKSLHAPQARFAGHPQFRGGSANIRWRATDADRDPLEVDLQYSGDDGRSWRSIWMGPNRGQATVPSLYLFRSGKSRLSISVSDGFQTTKAISRRFHSPGAAPIVHILSPLSGLRQPRDAPLVLTGQAFDDRLRLLSGRHLRWMLGRRVLGRGVAITVSGLPPGHQRIALLATDSAGRTSAAYLLVGVQAVRPLFLKLVAPRRVGRHGGSLKLRVASSIPATLAVHIKGRRDQRFAIGRRIQALKVVIPAGRGALTLRLTLRSGALSRAMLVRVVRH